MRELTSRRAKAEPLHSIKYLTPHLRTVNALPEASLNTTALTQITSARYCSNTLITYASQSGEHPNSTPHQRRTNVTYHRPK